jgi:transposase
MEEKSRGRSRPQIRPASFMDRQRDRTAVEQAEGQINRLETLKRALYGRAGPNLLRARMRSLHNTI